MILIPTLNELVSISLDTSYSQEVIQNGNVNESFEDNADGPRLHIAMNIAYEM